jgi:hypothetical protein
MPLEVGQFQVSHTRVVTDDLLDGAVPDWFDLFVGEDALL